MAKVFCLYIFISILFARIASGEEQLNLVSFDELPQLIWQNNFKVKLAKSNWKVAVYEDDASLSPFDLNLYSSLAEEKKVTNPNSAFDMLKVKEKTSSFSLGVTRDFYYGTKLDFSVQMLHIRSDSKVAVSPRRYQGAAKLKLDQPILNGFGPSNIAEKFLKAEPKVKRYEADLYNTFAEELKSAVQIFWKIVSLDAEIDVQKKSIEKLKMIEEYAKRSHALGLKRQNDFLQAEASLARDMALLEKLRGERFQSILQLLAKIDRRPKVLDAQFEDSFQLKYAKDSLIDLNLELIPDKNNEKQIAEEKFRLEELMVDLMQKKNRMLPKLDLQIELSSPSLSKSKVDAIQDMAAREYNNFKISLNFVWFIENLAGRGDYTKSFEAIQQQNYKMRNSKQSLIKDLFNKREELKISKQVMNSLQERKSISTRSIEIEKIMMQNGRRSMLDFLEELENWMATEQECISQQLKIRGLINELLFLSSGYFEIAENKTK